MTDKELYKLRFPTGEFTTPEIYTQEILDQWISEIVNFPENMNDLISGLNKVQLQLTYRPGGWNIQQVLHHCADSHMNSIIRFKLTLTEVNPIIKPYEESKWAILADGNTSNLKDSLAIIKGVHGRWGVLLNNLSNSDLHRSFIHPETGNQVTIKENIGIYAWHCRHHLGHIKLALKGSF